MHTPVTCLLTSDIKCMNCGFISCPDRMVSYTGTKSTIIVTIDCQLYTRCRCISIIPTPSGPINESSTVILTCDITGGHPLATITWMCEGSSPINI
jgi:hypothetical protein